jgi:hypothetical protein
MFIVFQNVIAQNAYYDALFLNTLSEKGLDRMFDAAKAGQIYLSLDEFKQIEFAKDFIKDPFDVDSTINELFDVSPIKSAILKYNKFLEYEYSTGFSPKPLIADGSVAALGILANAISGDFSLSSEDQTKILDGLTKYYAEEFKKAQLLTYMQTFEDKIGEVGELQVLFPNTYEKLKNTNPSKFPELGDEYKEIFSQDLRALIDNLIKHIDNHASNKKEGVYDFKIEVKKYSETERAKKKKERIKDSLISTYYILKQNASLDSTLVFLNGMNTLKIKTNENFSSVKLSADIGSKLVNNYHPVDLFNYLDGTYYKEAYLTDAIKLDEKLGVIIHGVNLFQRNLLDTTKSKTSQFSNVWLNFEDFNKINTIKEWELFAGLLYQQDKVFFKKAIFDPSKNQLTEKNIKIPTQTNLEYLKGFYLKILSALNEIQEFRNNLNEDNLNENYIEYMKIVTDVFQQANYNDEDISKFFKISNYSLQVYDNARSKDYSNSIHYVTLILNEFLGTNSSYLETMQKIDQYGTFMTDVVNSEDSDEVKEVIKKHAAPPASFILKREYARTFSITGQPGYFISGENLNDDWGFVSGITLPIGFEYTFKLKKGQENSCSFGIFAQVIDLGAMLNFRVSDSTSTLPDDVTFSQIFSPGGSLTYGFKNSPLTLGLGYQYTSELRNITLDNGNETYPNGHRIFLRLAWDIPFLNIWKSKEK